MGGGDFLVESFLDICFLDYYNKEIKGWLVVCIFCLMSCHIHTHFSTTYLLSLSYHIIL